MFLICLLATNPQNQTFKGRKIATEFCTGDTEVKFSYDRVGYTLQNKWRQINPLEIQALFWSKRNRPKVVQTKVKELRENSIWGWETCKKDFFSQGVSLSIPISSSCLHHWHHRPSHFPSWRAEAARWVWSCLFQFMVFFISSYRSLR